MILGASYGTISDIEVMWTLIAAVGLGFSVWNLLDAKGDMDYYKSQGIINGRMSVARTNVWTEVTRAMKQFIFLIIGFLAFFLADAPNSLDLPTATAMIRFIITWGIIFSSLLTTFQSYLTFRLRRQLKSDR